MQPSKKSFFERLTGTVRLEDEDVETGSSDEREVESISTRGRSKSLLQEDEVEAELSVDVYQTPDEIVLRTMCAGVRPEDLDINITRDMVTIRGKRQETEEDGADYFHKELYWGSFARTIMLPEEIEVEEAEAVEKHGLLTIRLPKVDKSKKNKLRVKSV